jgi:hypothetical protein
MKKFTGIDVFMFCLIIGMVSFLVGVGVNRLDHNRTCDCGHIDTVMVEVIDIQPQKDGGVTLVETTSNHQRCYLEGAWGKPGEMFVVSKKALIHFHEEPKNEG